MTETDPYRVAGLQRNPFVVLEDEGAIPEVLWLDRSFPPAPAPGQKRLIQIIGPPGTGKTSLLFHWRERIPGPYRHYPPGIGRFRMPPVAPMVYWDEADRIPRPFLTHALRRAARQSATVICGTHEDLTGPATRFGFAIETIEPPPISPAELIAWANMRIRRVQLDPHQAFELQMTPEQAEAIARESGHSWRRAADLLHIWMARNVAHVSFDARETIGC